MYGKVSRTHRQIYQIPYGWLGQASDPITTTRLRILAPSEGCSCLRRMTLTRCYAQADKKGMGLPIATTNLIPSYQCNIWQGWLFLQSALFFYYPASLHTTMGGFSCSIDAVGNCGLKTLTSSVIACLIGFPLPLSVPNLELRICIAFPVWERPTRAFHQSSARHNSSRSLIMSSEPPDRCTNIRRHRETMGILFLEKPFLFQHHHIPYS